MTVSYCNNYVTPAYTLLPARWVKAEAHIDEAFELSMMH
jgi:hypothetical protein